MNAENNIQLDVTFSTRTLLAWAELLQLYEPMKTKVNLLEYTLMRVLGNMASETSRFALLEILQRVSNKGFFMAKAVTSESAEE